MTLLALENVGKRYRHGLRERLLLDDVSLELSPGELAAVWGPRRSGRSTLLRVAAGIERPDSGVVRFDGRDLIDHGEELLGEGIGYVQKTLRGGETQSALEEVVACLLARGIAGPAARARARAALERTGAAHCAALPPRELDRAESVRVALARTLVLNPRLVIIDEPVNGVELLQRDGILALLRSLAREGVAVLASTADSTGLSGADRALALSDGELRGSPGPELAPVLALRRSA
jgi:ABC-type multidrug transport system ATPase subunit